MAWLTHLTRILHTFYRGCLSVFSGLSYNKRSMATCIRGQLSWILDSQLRDTAKASLMLPDGSYCRKHSAVPFDSQDTFMQQSPHIPAAAAGAPKERVHWLKDLAKSCFGREVFLCLHVALLLRWRAAVLGKPKSLRMELRSEKRIVAWSLMM